MVICKKCYRKPTFMHRNEDGLPSAMGFSSKVVFKDEFLNYLYVPPRFARKIAPLANKELQIKDGSGRGWIVKLSYIHGVLAFGRGWRSFTLEHGIKRNDQVLFRHVSGSDFTCEIFGVNSSKRQIPSSSNTRASSGSANKDSCYVPVTDNNKEESSIAHGNGLKRKFAEDASCILNRDSDYEQNVDRRCFLDLSVFETYKCIPICDDGSSSVQDGGFEYADTEEQIHESLFVENSVNLLAFEVDMRIPSDDVCIGGSEPRVPRQYIPEKCPSTSSISDIQHKMEQTAPCQDIPAGPSLDAQPADLYAQAAAFQGMPMAAFQGQTANVTVSTGPAVEAQTTDFNGETTAFQGQTANFTGPAMEAQTAGFGLQTTTPTDQDVEKGPKECSGSEGATFDASVRIAKNEQKRFSPQPFVGSANIVKKERNEFNPQGLGSSVRNVKIERKNSIPNVFGGRMRIVKKEPTEQFNPKSFGSIRTAGLVKKEPTDFESRNIGASSSYQVLKKVKIECQDFTPPQSAVTCEVPVTSDDEYLMLPKQFSSLGYRTNKNVERKMEHIRDSTGRLWPVMWCRISGENALTAGWKSLRDANEIRIGDGCVFSHEDDNQDIIKVNVIKK